MHRRLGVSSIPLFKRGVQPPRFESLQLDPKPAGQGAHMIALGLRRHTVTLCTLAAICGFFAIPVAARGSVPADLPRGSEWENPFCNGSAIAVPWDAAQNAAANGSSSKTVAVFFWANANSDYEARVTLIGNGAAYGVDIPRTAVTSSPDGELRRYAYLVSLPSPIFLDYYFVDGAGVDL